MYSESDTLIHRIPNSEIVSSDINHEHSIFSRLIHRIPNSQTVSSDIDYEHLIFINVTVLDVYEFYGVQSQQVNVCIRITVLGVCE